MTSDGGAGMRLRECQDCGLFQRVPPVPASAVARCPRCHAILRRRRTAPVEHTLAFAVTGLLLFVLATQLDFMSLDFRGRIRDTHMISGPIQLQQHGMWELAVVVLLTTFAAPLGRLACLAWVMLGLRLRDPPGGLHVVFRWAGHLRAWSMIEVFVLGVFVAYTRLGDIAEISVGGAVYALGALMLAQIAADVALDSESVWQQIHEARIRTGQIRPSPTPAAPWSSPARLIGCDTCRFVSDAAAVCPRCEAKLERRKANSIGRTTALIVAAAILYIPANFLPVMDYVSLGRGAPDTILSGVEELAGAGMWPLALLVFFASITVPVLKLVGLSYLLITTRRRSGRHLRARTIIFRVVDQIGRWSMIDVFMISILTALVRLGAFASVFPEPGVLAFCAVVILTLVAAMSFDPRLMWDAAGTAPRI